jgi:hypothetical protein
MAPSRQRNDQDYCRNQTPVYARCQSVLLASCEVLMTRTRLEQLPIKNRRPFADSLADVGHSLNEGRVAESLANSFRYVGELRHGRDAVHAAF